MFGLTEWLDLADTAGPAGVVDTEGAAAATTAHIVNTTSATSVSFPLSLCYRFSSRYRLLQL